MIPKHLYKLTLYILLCLLALGCRKESLNKAPFFDGFYLEYKTIARAGEKLFWEMDAKYRFKKISNSEYKLSQEVMITKGHDLISDFYIEDLPKTRDDIIIDDYGTVKSISGGYSVLFVPKFPSHLWLPNKYRVDGEAVFKGKGDLMIREVHGKTVYRDVEVWPVQVLADWIDFYDAKTGLLVGSETALYRTVLVDTNYPELKALISKLGKTEDGVNRDTSH